MALQFQPPNFGPAKTAAEGLAAGLAPAIQQIPSLLFQYKQFKQQQELADKEFEFRRDQANKPYSSFTGEYDEQGNPKVATLPAGTRPGPSLPRRDDMAMGRQKLTLPKSEYLKNWERYQNADVNIIDDVGATGSSTQKLDLTPAQKKIDELFGKEYTESVVSGGTADVAKSIGQLKEVQNSLLNGQEATGPILGLLPKAVRDVFNAKGATLQDMVEEVVQRNLRLVLGAQFTEKEGTRLIERAYNPRLDEAENSKRIGRLINQIQGAATAQADAIKYYEENGTLKGYKGIVYTGNRDKFMDTYFPDDSSSKGTSGSSSSPQAFGSLQDAEAANLPAGTIVTIGGRRAVVE